MNFVALGDMTVQEVLQNAIVRSYSFIGSQQPRDIMYYNGSDRDDVEQLISYERFMGADYTLIFLDTAEKVDPKILTRIFKKFEYSQAVLVIVYEKKWRQFEHLVQGKIVYRIVKVVAQHGTVTAGIIAMYQGIGKELVPVQYFNAVCALSSHLTQQEYGWLADALRYPDIGWPLTKLVLQGQSMPVLLFPGTKKSQKVQSTQVIEFDKPEVKKTAVKKAVKKKAKKTVKAIKKKSSGSEVSLL